MDRRQPSKSTVENDKDISEIWAKIRAKYELVDSFRILNPKLRRYSYVRNNAKSRIDRIYITEGESGKIQTTKFFKTPWEDHKIYKIDVFNNIDTGPGQWALNVKLLNDPTFLKTLGNEWIEFRKYKNDFQNIKDWWDAAKNYMRTIAVSYAQLKSQIKRDVIEDVENQIEILESKDLLSDEEKKNLNHLKEIFLSFEKDKSEGYRIRSKIPHFETEEPNINYYSKMEKINTEKNLLYALYDSNENLILKRGTKNVLKITAEFYRDLYTKQNCDENIQKELLNNVNKSLSATDKEFCDEAISLIQLENAMKEQPLHKSPGLDGLPVEFYRSMWETMKHDFYDLVTEISKDKDLTFSQKKGAIRIVFKKQDRHNLKYYRPITLLNTDIKIITKVLAVRLRKVLPSLIDLSQTCLPGRNITKNVHTLQDLIKYANSENISAAILFIDQEKTFDRVSHSFLLKTLKQFNFGPAFISWIKTILADIKSQVKVNGFLTEEINVTRGIRQGCPISAFYMFS